MDGGRDRKEGRKGEEGGRQLQKRKTSGQESKRNGVVR